MELCTNSELFTGQCMDCGWSEQNHQQWQILDKEEVCPSEDEVDRMKVAAEEVMQASHDDVGTCRSSIMVC